MYEQTLIQAGLTKNQALVYEVLVKNGPLAAGKVAKKTPLKRGLVYKVLEELEELSLVEQKNMPGKAARFEPAHPLKLKELAEARERQAKDAQIALVGTLSGLISDFNLVSGRPGVQFYEGQAGVKTVAEDSLTSKTEILSYLDSEAIAKEIKDFNLEYVKQRRERGIKKKILTLDSPYARKHFKTVDVEMTEVRFMDEKIPPFQTVMQMYDNKISYITLRAGQMIGVIVSDPTIYQMHRALFEYAWRESRPAEIVTAGLPSAEEEEERKRGVMS